MGKFMERARPLLKWVVVALILFGMVYNFILPFTPVWFDIAAWSAIAIAVLIAWIGDKSGKEGSEK